MRHEVEFIEYTDRDGLRDGLVSLRKEDDVVSIDVIDLGKTLRVTRLVLEDSDPEYVEAAASDPSTEVTVQAGSGQANEEPTAQAETLSDASADGSGAPAPAEPAEPVESGSDVEDLIGAPEPDLEAIVKKVHDSSLAEIEKAVADGELTAEQVLAAETGPGGKGRQNVQYAFRVADPA